MKVVLYARVSTTKQAEKDLSIPDQLRQLQTYCGQNKHVVVKEYREEGASATDDKRPIFQLMMGEILNGNIDVDAILVLTTSRFFRDATAARIWKHNLRKKNIRVIATTQETSDDPMGDFIEGIFELIDQYESQMNGFHTLRGMKENARRGYFNGSNPPFGYARISVNDERGNLKTKLHVNASESEIVRRIFSLYTEGFDGKLLGGKQIAHLLNKEKVVARDSATWSKQRVLSILSDTTYVGEYIFNKRDSKTRLEKPREEWIAIEVDPIVSLDTFEEAQRIRISHEPARKPGRTSASPLALSGIIKCGQCGAGMTLETAKGGAYRYYNCRRFLREGKSACPGQRVPCMDFEKAIMEHLADVVFSEERVKTIVKEVSKAHADMRKTATSARERLKKQLDEIERKLQRQAQAIEEGVIDLDTIGCRVLALREEREAVVGELKNYEAVNPIPNSLLERENVHAIQTSLKGLFLVPGSPIARRYTRYLIDEIVVTGTDVKLRGKTTAFLNTLAQNNNVRTGDLPVLTLGNVWLRELDSNQRPSG